MADARETDEERRAGFMSSTLPRASMKREMMCRRFEILQRAVDLGDLDEIQMTLGDFLMEARSLHDVIQNEGKGVEGFTSWWAKRKKMLRADPLMRWAHSARVGSFHHGMPSIEVTGMEIKGAFEYDPRQMSGRKNLVVSPRGFFFYSDIGTPDERIERARLIGADISVAIQVSGLSAPEVAPQTLQGLRDLCGKILKRNQELLHEVKSRFPGAARYG